LQLPAKFKTIPLHLHLYYWIPSPSPKEKGSYHLLTHNEQVLQQLFIIYTYSISRTYHIKLKLKDNKRIYI
jgi:hypothetical protein